ncbi:snapalysin family zinc-dependent metalloprotease [Lentzea aerocolonigenes]|uniref:snapalysin family zinc-dependent metalloprotease n=1 Tax=Lentzea aerocolonigenes TaxID=68170 RepID=UPI0004C3BFFB|nr:snapalysin family zinc-dependent metalloprotease [Lentzea aerocolonigenes]MCP2246760.1 snapalysin [Lentzea aerocolonigenes]
MFLRKTIAVLASAAALSLGVVGTAQAARTITYDSTGAALYESDITEAVKVWNASVKNVQIKKAAAGTRANFTIVSDPGWPRAQPTTLGNGKIWMGKQAVDQGYNKIRIAAHEIGHILGLPDIKPGPCSSLMSGSTGGVPCTNPNPNAAEKSRVERNFAGTAKADLTSVEDAA